MDLQAWMTLKQISDAKLAADAGISRSQVSRIRRRKCVAPPDTAKKLAQATGIPAEMFVFAERAA